MKTRILKVKSHPWRKGRRFRVGNRWETRTTYQECREYAAEHGYKGIKVN